jgi:Cdc6-like AAA superfamily ATPase
MAGTGSKSGRGRGRSGVRGGGRTGSTGVAGTRCEERATRSPPRQGAVARQLVSADQSSVFFVPFDSFEGPSRLVYSLRVASATDSPDEGTMPFCFDSLDVTVPAAAPGGAGGEVRYRINRNDNVLLRPPDNAEVPRIGRVVTFFRTADEKSSSPRLRVQWYYHACDMLDKPSRAAGEDELLETPHFNDVDADTIVGRCTVTSHEDYVRHVGRERVNSSAFPTLDDGRGGGGGGDGSDGDDGSCFGDNYSSASTRYWVREFYDACHDAVAIATFEDASADPAFEVVAGVDCDGSPVDEPPFGEGGGSSDDDDIDADDSGEDRLGVLTPSRARKRRRRRAVGDRPPPRPARGGETATQFPLAEIDVEDELPCREREKAAVTSFLKTAIEQAAKGSGAAGRCMYISGVPGTGKTATVREIVGRLRRLRRDGDIPPFDVVEVNGMTVADPSLIYSELYAAVVGKRVLPSRAQTLLGERFASNDERVSRGGTAASAREQGKCVILILDEMDVLVSRKEELLHKVLEWCARPNSRLALIGIANTMDLPERLLAKSKSRMGDTRQVYAPYTREQLIEILNMRLKRSDLEFTAPAINLAAAKIASLSGDVRRALELCRRAAVVARPKGAPANGRVPKVGISDINDASEDMTGGDRLRAVAAHPLNDRLVLIATLALSRSIGAFDVESASSLQAVFQKCTSLAIEHKNVFAWRPETEELQKSVSRLVASRVLVLERDRIAHKSRLTVNMSPEDVVYALKEDRLAQAELQHGREKYH